MTRRAWMVLAWLLVSRTALAQDAHDMHAMQGMHDMDDPHPMQDMQGMHGGHDMPMGRMQGGAAPPGARDPDVSDGLPAMPMHHGDAMGMDDAAPSANLLLDHVESFAARQSHGQAWEAQGWYGNDRDRLAFRTQGERQGRPGQADAELFWSHAIAAFWDARLGLREDFGRGPSRTWAAVGVEGLAPYGMDVEATFYAASGSRTAARLRLEYDLRFTQRLILQPELQLDLYGRPDRGRGVASGLANAEAGLRLRYEITRSVAPYVGIGWEHHAGGTAALARDRGEPITDRRWVAGVRLWF